MGQSHRKVKEKRPGAAGFVALYEVVDVVAKDIRAISALEIAEHLAILYDLRVPVARALGSDSILHMPEAILIEAGIVGAGKTSAF
ncbi:hypothetical protein ES703_10884 [subsurface metagenome]